MITGFNTDVQHDGVTYHVQTEDKGLDTPLILSLVYVGGAIIASKRTPYEDLITKGFDEQALTDRLQRQHKLICAAIKAGRVEDLKRMGVPNGGSEQPEPEALAGTGTAGARKAGGQKRKRSDAPQPPPPEAAALTATETVPPATETVPPATEIIPPAEETIPPAAESAQAAAEPVEAAPMEAAPSEAAPVKDAPDEPEIIILTSLADAMGSLDDFRPDPPRAPSAPTPEVAPAPLDVKQETPEPVPVEPLRAAEVAGAPVDENDEIFVSLLDDEGEFRAGQLVTIKIYVGRGNFGQSPVRDADLTVKVLGTAFRPLIVSATTDEHGVGVIRALLPRFSSGRAAIIIRAVSGGISAEMRRIIHQ